MWASAKRVHQQYSTPLDGGVGFSSGAAVCIEGATPESHVAQPFFNARILLDERALLDAQPLLGVQSLLGVRAPPLQRT